MTSPPESTAPVPVLTDAPVVRIDRDGRVSYRNESACRLFGVGPEDPIELAGYVPEFPVDRLVGLIDSGDQFRMATRVKHHPCTLSAFGVPPLGEVVIHIHEHWHSPFFQEFLSGLTKIGSHGGRASFFEVLSESLAALLEVPFVLVGELTGYPMRKLRVLALHAVQGGHGSREFVLSRSLAERVLRNSPGVVSIAERVDELFPNDALVAEIGIQSAAGVAINTTGGEPVGVIVALHTKPWRPETIDGSILSLFAAFAAAEIVRLHGDREMQFLVADLRQRMKELSCFYGLLESIRTREHFDDICRDLVELLPEAWQYPEIACARIVLDGEAFLRETFEETTWGMSSAVIANGRARGMVQMFYLEDRASTDFGGPFLAAERNLLDAVARILGEALQRREVEAEILEKSASLVNERNQLEMILRNIGDGVVVTDADNAVLLMNRAALHLLGLESGEPLHVDFLSFLEDEEFRQLWIETAAQHTPLVREELVIPGPEPRTVAMTRNEIPDLAHGRPGFVTIMQDVTKEREIDRMKSDFVSSVSHELRTPMTSIKGFVHTLQRKPDMPPEKVQNFLQIISKESERLLSLIEDLLTISRIEAGALKLEQQSVSVRRELERVSQAVEPLLLKKGVTMDTRVPPNLRAAHADPEKIYAVLLNLVDNAIKFTPAGGSIVLEARPTERGIEVSVEDTGIGIPEADRDRVFDRFYRVQRPGEEHPGTGLGLFIVRQIIEQHGGSIGVSSTEGQGTRFTLVLPTAGSRETHEQEV